MTQLALIPPHRNQQLFSDYFLDHLLPQRADWQALVAEAAPVMAQIKAIYDAYTPSNNEAQLETELARPVLKLLGHTFEVQAALKTPDGTKRPDYVFYRDQTALQANKNKTLTDALLQGGAIAVGDAKAWDVSLDATVRTAKSAPNVFTNKNPSFQISFYMQHSGLAWGMLTNGRVWRLYHKDTAHKFDRFYEVDLPALLAEGQPERSLYFYAMFRRAAFDAGPLSLDAMLQASRDYARGVGDSLKTQVYDALLHLAQGFLDHPDNQLQPDAATLKTIYDHSLIVLYRLLFILYAEARDLLPLRTNQLYRDQYSLMAIKRRVAADLDAGKQLLLTSTLYWEQLRELFRSIDQGNPPLHVATFNGGLFDAARYPFLQTKRIGDARLQHAVDLLARVGGEFVDYRDLAERHLGTIYEGLLEYHLEPLPAAAPSAPFTIDLRNDKGERKATGSYYTPDYIVKYIVDQTVGPVLHGAVDGLADDAAIINAVLDVNVLDPAMGSGHFLVEATERIARFLVDLGVKPDEDTLGEADVAYWRRRVVQSCIYGVDLNPLAVDLAKLSLWLATVAQDRPLSFLDHHLRTGNALIGARINDLQVGSGGAGAQRAKKKKVASSAQLSLLDDDAFRQSMSSAVDSMWLIESSPSASVTDVKAQEQAYAELRRMLTQRYGRLADLVTATYFGLQIDPTLWQPLADYATGRTVAGPTKFGEWIADAEQIAGARHFFHWELEFPEVFFDRHGYPLGDRAGFDAVIGNPPYIRQEELGPIKPYLAQQFPEMYHGVADLYVYFIGQGLQLLQRCGRFAYITSGTFRKLNFGAPLRMYLTSQATPIEIVEFGTQQVFSEAVTYPIILLVKKESPQPDATVDVRTFNAASPGMAMASPLLTGSDAWVFTSASLQRVLRGWAGSQPLGDMLSKPIYRGITTGLNEAFVIDQATRAHLIQQDPASVQIIKPFLRGEDLHRWHQEPSGNWIIFARRGINIDAYPVLKKHLEQYRERLEPRPSDWNDTQPWVGRKPGLYKWYEIQDSVEYYFVFEQPRIHSTKISLHPTFSLLTETAYAANTSYVLPVPEGATGYYLLALLNSKICAYYCRNVFAPKANGYYEVQPGELARFPVPIVAFTTPAAQRERLADKGRRLYEQFCQKEDYACVLGFVEHHLGDGERPVNSPDAEASGYTSEGPHTQRVPGLDQAARAGGLRSDSPPIHGPGDINATPPNTAVAPGDTNAGSGDTNAGSGDTDAGLGNNDAGPNDNAAEPQATLPEHMSISPEHVPTTPEHHANALQPHPESLAPHANTAEHYANVIEHHAESLARHANVTEPHAESPAQHANLIEHQANVAAQHSVVAPAPDIVHDLLAFLAQQMIDLHKQRQHAGEAFVLDLEGVLDAGAVDKLGRLWTPPKAGDAAALAEAQPVLGPLAQRRITLHDDVGALNEAQWRWLTKRRLKQVPNFAQVVQVFRDHQPPLAALDRRIAATDRLIDQIVYRLYGLSEDEIALVEGGAVAGA